MQQFSGTIFSVFQVIESRDVVGGIDTDLLLPGTVVRRSNINGQLQRHQQQCNQRHFTCVVRQLWNVRVRWNRYICYTGLQGNSMKDSQYLQVATKRGELWTFAHPRPE